jgi:hypothetical protein
MILLLACTGAVEPEPVETLAPLEPARLLRRVSLDLRGTVPSVAELDAVEHDPAHVHTLAAEWVEQPAFQEHLVHRLAERWHTRVDALPIEYQDYGLAPSEQYAFQRAVGDEPLRLAARVVADDRPWSDVLTADHTVANAMLLDIWPMAADNEPGSGWVIAQYTDGRPHAGVLTTNGLWWRYETDVSNLNRRRIAAVTRIFLCEDYLDREVSFAERDVDADVTQAVLDDPACQSCHASLDPAAGALMGFWWVVEYAEPEFANYHPERERLWTETLGVAPAWHGTPISGPQDLGRAMAADPRFDACAVSSTAELYWRRDTDWHDEDTLRGLRQDFDDADGRLKPLILQILTTPEYQDGSDARALTNVQLEGVVADLTGWVWEQDGARMLDADPSGVRVLVGGVDGLTNTSPQRTPGLTRTLVVKRVAELAAAQAMGGSLLQDEDAATLYWHLLGERPTDDQVAELEALSAAVEQVAPGQGAASVLAALLRDPAFLVY